MKNNRSLTTTGVAVKERDITRDLIKEIARDIGEAAAAHVEVMYPEAVKATSSTFLMSLRNCVYNEVMASIELSDPAAIRAHLADRKKFRREWRAQWRKIRARMG